MDQNWKTLPHIVDNTKPEGIKMLIPHDTERLNAIARLLESCPENCKETVINAIFKPLISYDTRRD